MVSYFFDSYAVIELVRGNPNYAKYSEEPVVLTLFNLVEIYWSCITHLNEDHADRIYGTFKECVVDVSDDILKEAVKFRKINKKLDLSYTDCIGYIYALKNNLLFLTGDKAFKDMKNVEFVSK